MFYNIRITKKEFEELQLNGQVILEDKITDDCNMCSNSFEGEIQIILED